VAGVVMRVPAEATPQTAAALPHNGKIPLSKIPRVHRAPKLEDFLENHPREAELTVTDFRQNSPGDGTPATEATTAYLSYDEKNLYVAFVCQDEPGQVRAHLSKREESDQDDGVGVLLDTFRDFHRAYYFFSNPLGMQTDAIYTEGQGSDYSFDTLWDNAGRILNDGYIVFFSIPFKSLRFSHEPQQTWGVALYRVILRKSEYDYWPYVTQRVEGLTQQFAPVGGLAEVSPGRNIQLIPYGLLASNHFLNQPVQTNPPNSASPPLFQDNFEHRAGLDAKFVAKDALTFDITLNPDFSQVESDEPLGNTLRFFQAHGASRPFSMNCAMVTGYRVARISSMAFAYSLISNMACSLFRSSRNLSQLRRLAVAHIWLYMLIGSTSRACSLATPMSSRALYSRKAARLAVAILD
jgi:hypothetical protein